MQSFSKTLFPGLVQTSKKIRDLKLGNLTGKGEKLDCSSCNRNILYPTMFTNNLFFMTFLIFQRILRLDFTMTILKSNALQGFPDEADFQTKLIFHTFTRVAK